VYCNFDLAVGLHCVLNETNMMTTMMIMITLLHWWSV